jgi:hypothetical protein
MRLQIERMPLVRAPVDEGTRSAVSLLHDESTQRPSALADSEAATAGISEIAQPA